MHQVHGSPQPPHAAISWPSSPSFMTKNLEEAQDHLQAVGSAALGVNQPGFFGGYFESIVHLNNVTLSMAKIESPDGYDLGFRPDNEYCLNIPMKGQGWIVNGSQVIEFDHTQAVFVSPLCDITKHWLGPSEVVTVHIPAHYLHSSAELALPATIAPITVIDRNQLRDFLNLIAIVCKACNDRASPMADRSIVRSLESAAISTLLKSLPGEVGEPEVRSAAVPYYVRRADHYMRANFRPGVTLSKIAAAVGVSERTLQYGFSKSYGKTPLQFFKQLRLNCARKQIVAGLNGKTLSEIAWAVGYQKASQFTVDYRAMFGENPSRTARHARNASIAVESRGAVAAQRLT